MNEMLAGYANYASTQAILAESHLGQWTDQPNTVTVTDTLTCITLTCSVTVSWTF